PKEIGIKRPDCLGQKVLAVIPDVFSIGGVRIADVVAHDAHGVARGCVRCGREDRERQNQEGAPAGSTPGVQRVPGSARGYQLAGVLSPVRGSKKAITTREKLGRDSALAHGQIVAAPPRGQTRPGDRLFKARGSATNSRNEALALTLLK